MKRILTGALAALLSFSAIGATLMPVQLLSPVGSTSGQVPVSAGSSGTVNWGSLASAGGLAAANNLSDVANAGTSLANLGGISAAAAAATYGAKASPLSQFATTTSVQLAGVISDETGSGVAVFNVAPALTSPVISGTPTAPTASGGTNTTQLATTAFAQNAVTGGSNAGSFTTLAASGNDALLYTNTTGQSIPNSTDTIITTWTKTSDRLNANFNASTGVFTAPVTGFYLVSGQVTFSGATNVVNAAFLAKIVATSVFVSGIVTQATTATVATVISIPATVVSMVAGNTLSIQVNQATGSARTLSTSAGATFLSVYRLP